MEWYVFYHNFNERKIEKLNIFDHSSFAEDFKKLKKKENDIDKFAEELRLDLFYYFCSKCEYELVITPWIGEAEDIKVDVYGQVMLNFDKFLDYVWNFKENRRKN